MRVDREGHVLAEHRVVALAHLRELDHGHPDRVPGDVAEVVAAVAESLRHGHVHVVAGRAVAHRRLRDLEVLLVGLAQRRRIGRELRALRGARARHLDPVHAGPCDLERRQHEVAEDLLLARDPELRVGQARSPRRGQHHVHRQPAAALANEILLGGRHHLGRGLSGRVALGPDLEAARVDAHRIPHRIQLRLALDRAGEVELDVERHELEARGGERLVVAHGHDVVEPVDADALPAGAARPLGDVLARARVQRLLERRRRVLTDVARLGREDDERIAVGRHHDVRVAVDDLEARQVRDGALEARVLAASNDERVEVVLAHRGPHVGEPPLQLGIQVHEVSTPLMRAVMVSLSGVGTPRVRPKRAMPPLRKSISVRRRASMSCSIDALWL